MKVADYWKRENDNVRCLLCPNLCLLKEGEWGDCRNRKIIDGKLYSMVYGEPCAINTDPIEKKPLYHFLPGTTAFSLGTAGCNLACKNCQNYGISQVTPDETSNYDLFPEKAVEFAEQHDAKVMAYTYTEPVTFVEYVIDTATIAHEKGLRNAFISSGYINRKPLSDLAEVIDAANIDLKSFDNKVYKKLNAGRLNTILNTIETLFEKGLWLELTYLIVPDWSSDDSMIRDMCRWMVDKGMQDVPLHFSRFFPVYKLTDLTPTSRQKMMRAWDIAKEEGLNYVFLGNISGTKREHTYCPKCGTLVIKRGGFSVEEFLIEEGRCPQCNKPLAGVWQ